MEKIKIKKDGQWVEAEISTESFESISKSLEPEVKVGDWVFIKNIDFSIRYPMETGDVKRISSIDRIGYLYDWYISFDDGCFGGSYSDRKKGRYLRLATEAEIKEHLEKELIRRGYVKGAEVIDLCNRGGRTLTGGNYTDHDTKDGYRKESRDNPEQFWMKADSGDGIVCVYENGKFAEIIKDNTIQIDGCEVKYTGESVTTGCLEVPFDTASLT